MATPMAMMNMLNEVTRVSFSIPNATPHTYTSPGISALVICMNDTDRWRYAELDSQSDAAYSAPMGMTLLTYSFLGMFSDLVAPTTLTMIVATEVQNTMCQRVSAIGYLNPEYARMYCGGLMTGRSER